MSKIKLPPIEECAKIRTLYEVETQASNANEAAVAKTKLDQLLSKHGLKRKHISDILAELEKDPKYATQRSAAPPPGQHPDEMRVNCLSLVLRHIEDHVYLVNQHLRLAIALWVLHTYVFGWFDHTPRLAVLSPVRRCGKTTLMILLESLCANPDSSDGTTVAAIYQTLVEDEVTLLIDEGDNLGLLQNKEMRQLMHGGFLKGRTIDRGGGRHKRKFSIFAPLAIAAIGMNSLSLPLIDRSVIVPMRRRPHSSPRLVRLRVRDPRFEFSRRQIEYWKTDAQLNPEPDIPERLDDRAWDCWRVLIAIADSLGMGQEAREAAVALSARREDSDPVVVLLRGMRRVLGAADRITTAALASGLEELGFQWTGMLDNRPPRAIKQGELSHLLRKLFDLETVTVWPAGSPERGRGAASGKGYHYRQLEPLFDAYVPDGEGDEDIADADKIVHIGHFKADT
jgi:hypothetical protein